MIGRGDREFCEGGRGRGGEPAANPAARAPPGLMEVATQTPRSSPHPPRAERWIVRWNQGEKPQTPHCPPLDHIKSDGGGVGQRVGRAAARGRRLPFRGDPVVGRRGDGGGGGSSLPCRRGALLARKGNNWMTWGTPGRGGCGAAGRGTRDQRRIDRTGLRAAPSFGRAGLSGNGGGASGRRGGCGGCCIRPKFESHRSSQIGIQ